MFFASTLYGQTPEEIKAITVQYDMAKLKEKEAYYRKLAKTEKEEAQAQAIAKGWPLFVKKDDGNILELMRLTPDGYPIYYSTENVNAARTTRASFLNTGGGMGLNLNGQGRTVIS